MARQEVDHVAGQRDRDLRRARHRGLHGDVFAIGGSYAGSERQAFFALAIGRRVDLKVRPR